MKTYPSLLDAVKDLLEKKPKSWVIRLLGVDEIGVSALTPEYLRVAFFRAVHMAGTSNNLISVQAEYQSGGFPKVVITIRRDNGTVLEYFSALTVGECHVTTHEDLTPAALAALK